MRADDPQPSNEDDQQPPPTNEADRNPATPDETPFGPAHLLNDPNNFPEAGKAAPEGSAAAWAEGTKVRYLPARDGGGRKIIALWDPQILGWYKTPSEVSGEILAELSARNGSLDLFEHQGKLHIKEEQDSRVAPWPLFLEATEDDLRGIIDRCCVFYDRPKKDQPPVRLREPYKQAVKDLTKRRYKELRGKFPSVLTERLKHVTDPRIVAVVDFVRDYAAAHNGEGVILPSSQFHELLVAYLDKAGKEIPEGMGSAGKLTEALEGMEDTFHELGVHYRYHRSGKIRKVTCHWIGK